MPWRLGYHRIMALGAGQGFGHIGYNGSGAWCDPARGLAFAYVQTYPSAGLTGDPASPFLLGARFTVADIYLAVLSRWLGGATWLPEACPRLATLGRAVAARPAIAAVWQRHASA